MVTEVIRANDRILVMEDDPFLQTILKYELEAAGYEVQVAGDGLEGLDCVDQCTPDLILMDVMMPGADGNEVCHRLKASPRTRQIPIIMLTAMSGSEDRLRGLGQGANDYVTKPFERKELLARVRNLIEWGRLQRDANPLTGLPGNITIEAELARRIAHLAQREIELIPGALQAGGTMRRCPDISKLAQLGYKPRVPLSEGLKPTLDWYWSNANLAPKT